MRVLLTGGTGFLGAWVARRLLGDGHAVRAFDRNAGRAALDAFAGPDRAAVECVAGDVSDPDAVAAAMEGCDGVVHLAAVLMPACQADPIRGASVNLLGTLAVFEAARRHAVRQVAYASSASVFGPDSGDAPWPVTQYGAFKLACEGAARAYWHDHGIASVGLRPLVVYGPGRETGLTAGLSLACRHAARGEPYVIPFTGRTDAIFVDDVAAAFAAAATRPVSGAHAFNLHGEVVSVEQVIATLSELCPGAGPGAEPGTGLGAAGPPIPIAPERTAHDTAAVLGPLPRTSLRDGLARTLVHYRAAPP